MIPSQISAMRDFIRWAIRQSAWNGFDLDGFDIQEKAESLGLIQKVPYDPDKHGESEFDIEPGDDWYEFAPFLREDQP